MKIPSTPIRRWTARISRSTVVVALLVLSGCGLGIVYPRLDSIGAWYVGRLVTLDDAQSAQLDGLLGAALARHRASELEQYSTFLRALAGSIEVGADAGVWQQALQQLEVFQREVGAELSTVAIEVGRTLTDEQVTELLASLAERDEEEWQEYGDRTPAQQLERRQKALRRTIEKFTGRLDARQRALVDRHAEVAGSFMVEWRDNRRAWREALAEALALRGSSEEFARRMTILVARPDETWTAQYRAAIDRRRTETIGLLAELDATLTKRQRDTASRKVVSLSIEIARLAQSGERKGRA